MKGTTIVFCVALVPFTSCISPSGPGESFGPASVYMPLEPGNTWFFTSYTSNGPIDSSNENQLMEVIGTKVIDATPYHVVTRSYRVRGTDSMTVYDTGYYRTTGSQLYRCRIVDGAAYVQLLAEFSLEQDQSFVENYETDGGSWKTTVKVVLRTENETTFFYDAPDLADDDFRITFRKGVGIVDEYSPAWGLGLHLVRSILR